MFHKLRTYLRTRQPVVESHEISETEPITFHVMDIEKKPQAVIPSSFSISEFKISQRGWQR